MAHADISCERMPYITGVSRFVSRRQAYDATEGPYSGFRPTMLCDALELALQFALHGCLQCALARRGKSAEGLVLVGLCGATTAAAVTTPLVVTKMQCGAAHGSASGVVQVLQQAAQEPGPLALFDGMACSRRCW